MKREKLDLSQEDGYAALQGHVVRKAQLGRQRYGPRPTLEDMRRLLEDRDIVRHPTQLVFDSSRLKPGEFGHAEMVGEGASRSYQLLVHEHFKGRAKDLPLLIAYHVPSVNYSDLVTHEEAELFGATLLGMDLEAYYGEICRLAHELAV